MKVLQVIDSLELGGAEVLLKNYIIEANKSSNTSNDICVLYDSKSYLNEEILRNNIKIHSLGLKSKYSLSSIFRLVNIIKNNKYDVVHVHLFPAQYIGSIASIFIKDVHFIFTEHNVFNRRREIPMFKILDYMSYKRFEKVVCCSNLVKENLDNYLISLKNKTEVIYNGLKIELVQDREITFDAILVGSLRSNVKGVDIFLKSIKLLGNKIKKVAIAGDGILKEELLEQACKLGIDNKVEFLGNRNDIGRLLEMSKLFVLPSRWEGLPIALLEAMAKKKPIIVTNVGGIPEVIMNNKNGILISPENEAELAEKIELLLNSEELSKRIGEQAFQDAVNKFSIDKYAFNINKLYNKILKNK